MIQIKQGTISILLVEVPEDAIDFEIHDRPISQHLTYKTGMGTNDFDILAEMLPSGYWEEVGKADKLSEEEWRGIVERKNLISIDDKWLPLYKDYLGKGRWFMMPSKSGYSLIASHSLKPETTIILINND